MEIDDSLYSRQRYVLGDEAMRRLLQSKIFLSGIGGLGAEIAKNLILAGIEKIVLHDNKVATIQDVGTHFFLTEDDIHSKINRAQASVTRFQQLNCNVQVGVNVNPLEINTDLSFLKEFQCVILTEASLDLQLKVDTFCRQQKPPIKFIVADCYGAFGWIFCDFSNSFEVYDKDGEEPQQFYIENISQGNPGVVSCLQNRLHGLETGDVVTFSEVKGMDVVNNKRFKIEVVSPSSFSIGDTRGDPFAIYTGGGICQQIKMPHTFKFVQPSIHLGMLTLHKFCTKYSRLPNPWDEEDAELFSKLAHFIVKECTENLTHDATVLKKLSMTCRGFLVPLASVLGGFAAQEALKAVSGKFSPLQQWLHLDAMEVTPDLSNMSLEYRKQNKNIRSRYAGLSWCVGQEILQNLADLKLFLVGCGAIGCELLKIFALLGISSEEGLLTITDNDLIEKSNLNRQFLFRSHHIQHPKSVVAADAVKMINPDIKIEVHQKFVSPKTADFYNDAFFERQNVIVAALDSIEARRYVDSRCVQNCRPLLESGTLGTKGHVQVIVPYLTESYANQVDPPEVEVPFCTLKSFPSQIEHTIQWARDKFENLFANKPTTSNKFWAFNSNAAEVIKDLKNEKIIEYVEIAVKIIKNKPYSWIDCVKLARLKFEKYFNHKAKQLLHNFPLETKLSDGSPFWQNPKRSPIPVKFNITNDLHKNFIRYTALLLSKVYNIPVSQEEFQSDDVLQKASNTCEVPQFEPKNKFIETDESSKKPQNTSSVDDPKTCAKIIESFLNQGHKIPDDIKLTPLRFSKDDMGSGHIQFITAASNLRAAMYGIEAVNEFKTKQIAGKITPAIATTTSTIAGLVSLELLKLVKAVPRSCYSNCFLNLALPLVVFSEPGVAQVTVLRENLSFTQWDRWIIRGNPNLKLEQFINELQRKTELIVNMVVDGSKIVYIPNLHGHQKRLNKLMNELLKVSQKKYTDLSVAFTSENEKDIMGPPVRYYFNDESAMIIDNS